MRSVWRRDEFKEAGASARIVFNGVSMMLADRPGHRSAAGQGGRAARRRRIGAVHRSSKGGARILGVHAGVGAQRRNGN
jgi:hypothetical protein